MMGDVPIDPFDPSEMIMINGIRDDRMGPPHLTHWFDRSSHVLFEGFGVGSSAG